MHTGLQHSNVGLAASSAILQDMAAELELCKSASFNHFSTCHSSYNRLHGIATCQGTAQTFCIYFYMSSCFKCLHREIKSLVKTRFPPLITFSQTYQF